MKLGEGVAELELERNNCVKKQCLESEKRKNVGYKRDERTDRRGGGGRKSTHRLWRSFIRRT